ncbi:hypothetical protein COT99_00370 [Candidatus Falkowbacteria bacterium CG10_big_fil_rev_8_21_14_0_10_43_10]|uniref:Uncharacterized protein n=1 Tax=Candidatus Falkowbacteria bacterium CG10_big_fil_rev_8_21_14_0_10_43_10 TaxID=1974567 RepID=A0A2H0V586_9BACT|nr:MAG: hypothetical protein COT99_00370 [Candidatus Falkowbacteria bacterium CG10_big_fil_rev_8_21_14_0_10_43_10]
MWYNIIPILLILISGIIIFYIITKKFPAVANLDLSTLPREKEKQVKQRIINNRLKRNLNRWSLWFRRIFHPVFNYLVDHSKELYQKLLSARENLAKSASNKNVSASEIDELLLAAEEAKKKEDFGTAEKIYIQIISIDSKNVAAFKFLGQLYLETHKIEEAKETLEHVLKLTKEDADVYANLAEVAKENGQLERAKTYYVESIKLNNENGQNYFNLAEIYKLQNNYKEAIKSMKETLKIEPKNPKYLDAMFNLSIISKDKAEALDAYKKLKDINPENAKLGEMKEQIDEL